MKIDVSDILKSINKETKEEVTYDFDSFQSRLGDFPIRSKSPVILRIANQENKKLLIQGTVDLVVDIPCGRCLENVPTSIHFDIDKELIIQDGSVVDEDMEEMDYLIGF